MIAQNKSKLWLWQIGVLVLFIFGSTNSIHAQTTTLRYASRLTLNIDSLNNYLDSVSKKSETLVMKNGGEVLDSADRQAMLRSAHLKLLSDWVRTDSLTSLISADSAAITAKEYNEGGQRSGTRFYKLDDQFTYHRTNILAPWSTMRLHKLQFLESSETKQLNSINLVKYETQDKQSWMWVQKTPSYQLSGLPYPIGNRLPGLVHEYHLKYDKLIVAGRLLD